MIADRLERIARQHPQAVALIDAETQVTYLELTRRISAFALYLSQERGVRPGETVGLFLPNCWQFVVGFFALAKIGAVCLPFNTRWRAAELRSYIERFPISAALTNRDLLAPWLELPDLLPAEKVLLADDTHFADFRPSRDGAVAGDSEPLDLESATALLLTTSGSTGRPRVAPRTQAAMLAGAANVAKAIGIRAQHRLLAVVPFYHANGFSNCMFMPLIHGATVVLESRFEPRAFARLVSDRRIQILIVSPSILRMLVDRDIDAAAFSSVDICLSSGAPAPGELVKLCRSRYGLRVRQLYGSSETGTISIEREGGPNRGRGVGIPIPGVDVRVLDSRGDDRPSGETGEVVVRSPAMTSGYLGEPELNVEAFVAGYFRTGDLGNLDRDGNLSIVGRNKRTINVGGIKVDPGEVEAAIASMPGVHQCRVLGVMDRRQSEIIKAVVAVDDSCPRSRRDLVAYCRQSLAEYKIPRIIDFVDAIPVDLAGKQVLSWDTTFNELSDTQNETTAAH